ncbi:MAG: hypothetical protein FWE25_03340 [Lachnospiraceae bacterium]|nr:hypothetical protein [Lachnospiraceae bacterium]
MRSNENLDIIRPVEEMMRENGIKPIGVSARGIPVYDMKDGDAIAKDQALRAKLGHRSATANIRKMRPGGGYTTTDKRFLLVNPDHYFLNRCRTVDAQPAPGKPKEKQLHVVVDHRAIREAESGRTGNERIVCHVFVNENGKTIYKETTYVGSKEFIEKFKSELSHEDMQVLKPLMGEVKKEDTGFQVAV